MELYLGGLMLSESETTMDEPMQTKAVPAAITDIGCEREINEDRYAVIDSPIGRAWICCDGMGGCLGGELAAQLAIDAIRRMLESGDFDSAEQALTAAIDEANRIIVLRRQNPAFSSMGTTVVAALIDEDEIVINHAGDSRAYVVREGSIEQLTVDHTYVQDLVERGSITQEEAMSHPQSHVLTKCLGAEPRLGLESQQYWIWDTDEREDILVLCTDGLYSLVSDEEIADQVWNNTPQESCVNLVELARSRGGFDNITLTVLPMGGAIKNEENPNRQVVEKKAKLNFPKVGINTIKAPIIEMNNKRNLGFIFLGIAMVLLAVIAGVFLL